MKGLQELPQNTKQPGTQLDKEVHGRRLGLAIVAILLALIALLIPNHHPVLSSFSFLNIGTTSYGDVVRGVGQPDREFGSGVHFFVYELQDGSELILQFISLDSLQASYRYLPETKECKRLLGEAPGKACSLNLRVEILQDTFKPGEEVPIRLIFSNYGNENIVFNTRFAPNLYFAPERFRDISFIVTSPTRRDFVPYLFMNVRRPQDDDFEILLPGTFLMGELNLEEFYDFSEIGEYSFQTIYLNVSDPGDGRQAWKGLIVSESVSVIIEE